MRRPVLPWAKTDETKKKILRSPLQVLPGMQLIWPCMVAGPPYPAPHDRQGAASHPAESHASSCKFPNCFPVCTRNAAALAACL
eukprot:3938407-Rhodomonas_salina.2